MNVVITGARGFVGQHLRRELTAAWPDVTITEWDLPEVDITQPATYRAAAEEIQPDWVIHLAALPAVGESAGQTERYFSVNVKGTELVLETLKTVSPATRVLVVSSAEVYGHANQGRPLPELPLTECRPANPYAKSKLAMEQVITERFADRVLVVRPFPHLGPGQKTGFVTADFAAQIAAIKASGSPGVIKVGNLTVQRDFTDVRDVVRAYRLLMEQGLVGQVFNVASGRATVIQTILDQLLAEAGVAIKIEQDATRLRPVDIPVVVGDAARLRTATGWAPTIPLDQSLRDVLEYWRRQRT